ncbi:MAG: CDP-glycerol glycerophosphotransferase family protein [Muribaculaceae bacterium]|nr:CDP-glycerol glycerophosphotransferase family protein [Muribaculaceae bacterium]
MKMKAVIMRAFAPIINLMTCIVNLFVWRDKRIILCGAWMGDKFADNSRNLYQYLFANQEQYGLKKVIWVTRNERVYNILKKSGYEVYMMHSMKSIYYHFKAGVYIICNIGFYVSGYAGDTMGHLAGHALKIFTCHGIPLKAGKSTGQNTKEAGIKGRIIYTLRTSPLFCAIFTPGHWDKAYYLSTGQECTRRCAVVRGISETQFIETGYPRDCMDIMYLSREKEIISFIRKSKSDKIILYVPTFREHGKVPNPTDDLQFLSFINESGYLWIEKPHFASKNFGADIKKESNNILRLEEDFDINVILPEISLLVTDYSSACYDAIAHQKPVLYYAPDYEYYLYEERGFVCDYKEFTNNCFSATPAELKNYINTFFNDPKYEKYIKNRVNDLRKEMFDDLSFSEEIIVKKIGERLGIFC